MIKKLLYFVFVIALFQFSSCSKYQRLLKSSDYAKQLELAIKCYEKHDYYRALQLFDNVIAVYRGKEEAEKIHYYYAYCYYGQSDYIVASYHFKNFAKIFPNSKYAEECFYMSAYSKYLDSPAYTLDQTSTHEALKELQLFINAYPKSDKVTEANKLIDNLRAKLILKAFEIAKLYYKTESYNAAQIAFTNILKDFPETSYREEIMYYVVRSNFYYAKNSIEEKQQERYKSVIDAYNALINAFPETKYKNDATDFYNKATAIYVNN
ncbi:MAG: outer membrane protein assembly factor BamD [Bacteroidetes bacterium]|nr:outer membrane protein assembly factor BamD [Bacteroidota bacterium]